jgi:CMP-N,N'-diacetyllegionaminic acid synthase
MQPLYLITARGGSKGLPGKNIKLLNGKPLIEYSIDIARKFASDNHICVSTDSQEIISIVQNCGLKVPFVRPEELSNDQANSRDVILHALDFYQKKQGISYEVVVLLQPTSPFRTEQDIMEMGKLFSSSIDMVVSVKEPHHNPYFSLFEEDAEGFLKISKAGQFTRRQDAPKVYAYNGSVYMINANSIRQKNFNQFNRIRKFVMNEINSVDIDTQFDWWIAEMILEKSLWKA